MKSSNLPRHPAISQENRLPAYPGAELKKAPRQPAVFGPRLSPDIPEPNDHFSLGSLRFSSPHAPRIPGAQAPRHNSKNRSPPIRDTWGPDA